MAFWNRRNDSELPTSQVEYQETTERRWPTLIGYMLLALLVATIVVLGGKWIYNKATDNSSEPPKPVKIDSENKKEAESNKKSESSNDSGGSSSSSDVSPSPNSSQNGSNGDNGSSSTPNPSSLPNNGPGQVVALFVGTSLAAAGLHYIVSLRRASSLN